MITYDVIVIGGGIIGCSILRELSKYGISSCLLEKSGDVCSGISKANSGVIHAGFNVIPGTLKSKLNVEGAKKFKKLSGELNFEYKEIGKLTIGFEDSDLSHLENLKKQGEKAGLENLKILDESGIKELEPQVNGKYALLSPQSGIISPFTYNVRMANNAIRNGAAIKFFNEVTGISYSNDLFHVGTINGVFKARAVINSSGLNSDRVAGFLDKDFEYYIKPCRGEYIVTDEIPDPPIRMLIYPKADPVKNVLGVHLTPTLENNIILGPSSEFIGDKDDLSTTRDIMDMIISKSTRLLPNSSAFRFISSFSGIRPKLFRKQDSKPHNDFYIKRDSRNRKFINLAGIESPGLTASAAMAEYVTEMLAEDMEFKLKQDFEPCEPSCEDLEEEIVCKCRKVSRSMVVNAMNDLCSSYTMDAIKKRTMAMTGKCQGSFCLDKIASIVIKEKSLNPSDVIKDDKGSNLFTGFLK